MAVMPAQVPGRSKQDYATPEDFIRVVKRRLGVKAFTFDFAADATNAKAATYWTEADDSLSYGPQEWADACRDGWGWLNPPFATIAPWASCCREAKEECGASIAFLVPAGVGANWFRDHVDGHALVLFLNGRLAFMPDKPDWLYPKDCVLCLYAPQIDPGYAVWSWKGLSR